MDTSESRVVSAVLPTITRRGRRIVCESAEEYAVLDEPRPGVIAMHFEGWTTATHVQPFFDVFESALTRVGSLVLITNGDGCTGCETAVREGLTAWQAKNRASITTQHYFAPAAMMRMGLQMMSMESGAPVTLYRELAEFEAAVVAAYPQVDVVGIRARSK